jgi:IclR family acetate operon transcriptional repressor
VKSVRTALRVFETVAARQPVGLSELSRALDVPKPSVQRALDTLFAAGWLRRDLTDPGKWLVAARFAVLADTAPAVVAAREAARAHLPALRDELDVHVGLFVLDGDHMTLVAGPGGPEAIRTVELTFGPLPIHVSAAGRAILSRLPLPTRREVLDRSLRRYTDATLTDPDEVLAEVERAEADGFAVVAGEYQEGMAVAAAPVLDRFGMPIAAVAAFGDSAGFDRARFGDAVVACARAIGDDLGVDAPVRIVDR